MYVQQSGCKLFNFHIFCVTNVIYSQCHYNGKQLPCTYFIRYSWIYKDRVWFGFCIGFCVIGEHYVSWIPWFYVSKFWSNHRNMAYVRLICKRCFVHVVHVYIFLLIQMNMFSCFRTWNNHTEGFLILFTPPPRYNKW